LRGLTGHADVDSILARLLAANLDFRTAVSENAAAAEIQVRLHGVGVGPFAGNHGRIKRRYIVGAAQA